MEKIPDTGRLPLVIDSREAARTGRVLEGAFEIRRLSRLVTMLSREGGLLAWRAAFERKERPDGGHDDFVHLRLDGEVSMQCMRCLGDARIPVHLERGFRLVANEVQAAREDAEEAEFDVLAGGPRFDLGELIEDEAIMALPPIARHDNCDLPLGAAGPQGAAGEEMPGEERIRPFAGLADLKKRGH